MRGILYKRPFLIVELGIQPTMHVLMVSHNRNLAILRQAALNAQGLECVFCESQSEALAAMERESFDALAICNTVPEQVVEELHQAFTQRNPYAGVALVLTDLRQGGKDDPDAVVCGVEGPHALRVAFRTRGGKA